MEKASCNSQKLRAPIVCFLGHKFWKDFAFGQCPQQYYKEKASLGEQ
jgi:hypothetical protein